MTNKLIKNISDKNSEVIVASQEHVNNSHDPNLWIYVDKVISMYEGHLLTITIILGLVAAVFLIVSWIGYKNLKDIAERIFKNTADELVEELKEKYNKLAKKQIDQDKYDKEQDKRSQVEFYLAHADQYYDRDRFIEAIKFCNKALEVELDSNKASYDKVKASIYNKRGLARLKTGTIRAKNKDYYHNATNDAMHYYHSAVKDFCEAIGFDNEYANARYNKACAFSLMNKNNEDVFEVLKSAIDLKHSYAASAHTDSDFDRFKCKCKDKFKCKDKGIKSEFEALIKFDNKEDRKQSS